MKRKTLLSIELPSVCPKKTTHVTRFLFLFYFILFGATYHNLYIYLYQTLRE